jgi:proliferating cell nuclear antigen
MKIVLSDPLKFNQFYTIFNNMKSITDTINIYINNEGLYTQGLDNANISLYECKLSKEWFDEYYNEENYDGCLGINTAILHNILSIYNSNQIFELVIDSELEDIDFININYINNQNENENENKKFNKNFSIPLVNMEHNLLNITMNDADVDLFINSDVFNELINQLHLFDDSVEFIFKDEEIKLIASGEMGTMNTIIHYDDIIEYSAIEDIDLNQKYSLKYIKLFCNFKNLNNEMNISFIDERPMVITYNLNNDSFLKLFLAPKL